VGGFPGDVAYSQQGGVFTDINHLLPSNVNSQAVGINSAATPWIVGFYQTTNTTSTGFVDEGGTITSIDPFGSTFTQALGVNDLGEIVGVYNDAMGAQHGYIDNGGVFTGFDPPGSASTTINGLNDKGDIVGFYTNPASDSVIGFVGTPVPEPSTWAMMLAGFAGLGLLGYCKARRGRWRPDCCLRRWWLLRVAKKRPFFSVMPRLLFPLFQLRVSQTQPNVPEILPGLRFAAQ
jgi:PEP-CTERM motif